ncbi:MAG: glycosyltransferase family 2 protein, partial [Arcobacteraceae bacterium]
NVGRKKSSPLKAILNAKFSFFKTYFLKRGFLDGYAGLIIAFSHMATNFYKYIKLYELNKEIKSK